MKMDLVEVDDDAVVVVLEGLLSSRYVVYKCSSSVRARVVSVGPQTAEF
jgi:hypothetical protein